MMTTIYYGYYGYVAYIFVILLLGHLIADFVFQTNKNSQSKIYDKGVRFYHCLTYALITTFCTTVAAGISLVGIAASFFVLFITHYFIDDYRFTKWVCKHIKQETHDGETPLFVVIMLDQLWHLIVLIGVAIMLVVLLGATL
jgi:predicted membrane channel-forming protein YqfA (hemolysin III family)